MRRINPRIIKYILKYIVLVLITSVIFLLVFISLPQTETFYKKNTFNLTPADKSFWKKEFVITLEFQPEEVIKKWQHINQTKNVLANRLNKLGVEQYRFDYTEISDKKGTLTVTVTSSKDSKKVESLLAQRSDLKIVTRKANVNFDDSKDPTAIYNPDNYEDAGLWRNDFRTIYITQLKTTSGNEAYFGIFKPWIWKTSQFDKFIEKYAGQQEGVYIDGFVNPIQIPVPSVSSSGRSAKPILSIGLSTDKDTAQLQNILYNSGTIPISYTYQTSNNLNLNSSVNYRNLMILISITFIFACALSIYTFSLRPTTYLLTQLLVIVSIVSFLKISNIALSSLQLTQMLIFLFGTTIVLEKAKNKMYTMLMIFILFGVLYLIPYSTLSYTSLWFMIVTILIVLFKYFSEKYISLLFSLIKK